MMILPALDDARGWRTLLFAATGVTALIYLYLAFFVPGTLTYAPLTIQDDARQFLTWMARLNDPDAMRGDLLADYWQSVGPWAYRMLFTVANMLGLEPLVFARLLPVPLLFLSVWMAWRIALALTQRPLAAFAAAALLAGFVLHEDSIYSATPRAFSAPLLLVFLDGLLRNRGWQMVPTLFVLGLLYPTTALVGLTMMGLSRVGWRPFRIDFSLRTWVLCGLGAIAVGAAVIPLAGATDGWGPTLTISDALGMENMNTGLARSAVVGLSGKVDLVCQARTGLLPEIVPCWSTRWAWLPNLLLLVPMLWLAFAALRRGSFRVDGEPGNFIYAWVLIAGIAWWAVAVAFAFSLHLPSRYTQRTLSVLEFIAIGQVAGIWLDARLRAGAIDARVYGGGGLLATFLVASFLSPTPGLTRPADPGAIARIDSLPDSAVIGGVSEELDFIPALTGHRTLASAEHSIPYHMGYFGPLRDRLEDALAAVSSSDPAALDEYVEKYGVTVIAVDRAFLMQGTLPERWDLVVPTAFRAAQARLARQPSALRRAAPGCIIHDGELMLLDAACLVRSPQGGSGEAG